MTDTTLQIHNDFDILNGSGTQIFKLSQSGDVIAARFGNPDSYVIFNDGTNYCAKNGRTGVVDSASAVLATVLQYVGTALTGGGQVYFLPGTYTLLATVNFAAGVVLDGPGATIDISGFNAVAFTFNVGGSIVQNPVTGIRNLIFVGANANTNTWVASFSSITAGVVVEKVSSHLVCNGILLTGACWMASIRNSSFPDIMGYGVHLVGNSVGTPNGAFIENNNIAGYTSVSSVGVFIEAAGYLTEGVKITGNWFENFYQVIHDQGHRTFIDNNMLDFSTYGITVESTAVGLTGQDCTVSNCLFGGNNTATYAIALTGNGYTRMSIQNNQISNFTTGATILYFPVESYVSICGNFIEVAGTGVCLGGHMMLASVCDNLFWGVSTATAISANGGEPYNTYTGNTFYTFATALTGLENSTVSGNTFEGITTTIASMDASTFVGNNIISSAGTITATVSTVRYNLGYVTENKGTSSGTGSQQTIAHGLKGTPSMVLLSEYTTGLAIPYQSAAADATNIYIKATSGKTYAWRAEL